MEMTLWNIEHDHNLREMVDKREELEELRASALAINEDTEVIDGLIAQCDMTVHSYVEREVRKVDGCRAFIRYCKMIIAAATAESKAQKQRADLWEARLNRFNGMLASVISSMDWKKDQVRKLTGATGTLLLKANGGIVPVLIHNESQIPDEFCEVTITINMVDWNFIQAAMFDEENGKPAITAKVGPRTAKLSLIRAELEKKCPAGCDKGEVPCDHRNAVEGDIQCPDCRNGMAFCSACGGSGKAGVPGAVLGERGESVICK